jgi:hypothetical protein
VSEIIDLTQEGEDDYDRVPVRRRGAIESVLSETPLAATDVETPQPDLAATQATGHAPLSQPPRPRFQFADNEVGTRLQELLRRPRRRDQREGRE